MTQILGKEKIVFGWTCQGAPGIKEMFGISREIIRAAGMTPARHGRVDKYPYLGGGGRGHTQFHPLMESYFIPDVYRDLQETKIILATCLPERLHEDSIKELLMRLIGPVLPDRGGKFKL
jgi:hypothetical protein